MKGLTSIVTFLMLIVNNASAQNEVSITGSWMIDINRTLELMSKETKEKYSSLNTDRQNQAKAAIEDRIFTFQDDGTIVVIWKSNGAIKESVGKWVLDAKEKAVSITMDNKIQVFDFSLSQANQLKLSNKKSTGMFTTLCLTRQ
jgi:hypothetical protein